MRAAALLLLAACATAQAEPLKVGSKRFTESYILGEIIRQTAMRAGTRAEHRQGLGGTGIVFAALEAGAIDIYPEYTGTIAREILDLGRARDDERRRGRCRQRSRARYDRSMQPLSRGRQPRRDE